MARAPRQEPPGGRATEAAAARRPRAPTDLAIARASYSEVASYALFIATAVATVPPRLRPAARAAPAGDPTAGRARARGLTQNEYAHPFFRGCSMGEEARGTT